MLQFIQEVLEYSLLTKHILQVLQLDIRTIFFYSESSHSPQQSLKNAVASVAGGFEDMTGQGAK